MLVPFFFGGRGGQNFEFQLFGGSENEYFLGMMKLWIFFWGGGHLTKLDFMSFICI